MAELHLLLPSQRLMRLLVLVLFLVEELELGLCMIRLHRTQQGVLLLMGVLPLLWHHSQLRR